MAAVSVFVAVGSLTLVGATLLRLAGGRRAAASLEALKTFMLRHNDLVMTLVFALIGLKLLGDGLLEIGG